ncbi:DUF1643 domain-containing protein [Alicyclobacillus cycloheptanicus]|uniref:DUF1643 domain-containing protein n=1 Tax=Alicyclobacillus cycloheptanicus TaxID=1457 RepID=A0ABT9XN90_9BACL|nr:DUF1643 domain-containing protein [Alicyclobacillus cycloheptanicus]MDQ0191600.1 hypothetical protein [Alicyclobacillus cycloheptanicus]WDM01860.1 DUF1643 domain-containing protein [Alicyclobacillus cycloheptanicus]
MKRKRIKVSYSNQGALIEGIYRYTLWREWNASGKTMVYVMLNPSTADGSEDDPTIEQCVHFAARDGYGSIVVVNLFAYRETDPEVLASIKNKGTAIGPKNWRYVEQEAVRADKLVLAWGRHGSIHNRHLDDEVRRLCTDHHVYCLGITKEGHPCHPGRLRLDTTFKPYIYPF